MMTGSQAMVECLEKEGISVLFGYPGATIAPFYDSLAQSSIRHILVRSEQHAGHAASGYARITGRPAVCVTTSGPGATNLFTGLATAYADSIPLVAITGQVSTDQLGKDVFQEVDTVGAVEPFTKYSYLVKDARDIPKIFKEAFYIASTGRPGPVVIDMPVDVQKQMLELTDPGEINIRGYKPCFQGHAMQIKRVAAAIQEAKRPLLCVGGGVFSANAAPRVRQFCELCNLPVVSTLMGIGVMPSAHPLNFGMLGMHGTKLANEAIHESDLLILIGARVGDRAVTAPQLLEGTTTIVHIDIDAAEIGKNLGTTIPLVGDAGAVMEQLIEKAPIGEWNKWRQWLDSRRIPWTQSPAKDGYINPKAFIRLLSEKLDDDVVYVADVGQNQLWSAGNYIVRNGCFLTTGGLGTMGYSLSAAIGAKLAAPQRQVIALCGDGSFQMSMTELGTACQHGVTVKLIVFRNGYLGLVREIQEKSYGGREMAVNLDGSPDFGLIAAAYGIGFERLSSMEAAAETIARFLHSPGSCILECEVDYREVTP